RRYISRCYESRRQKQGGWSSLHAHLEPATLRFVTLAHKQKHFPECRARECAQKILTSFETAEGRLGLARYRNKGVTLGETCAARSHPRPSLFRFRPPPAPGFAPGPAVRQLPCFFVVLDASPIRCRGGKKRGQAFRGMPGQPRRAARISGNSPRR